MIEETLEPSQQDLPICYRHPDKLCPGECQYVLPSDQCIHDRGELDEPKETRRPPTIDEFSRDYYEKARQTHIAMGYPDPYRSK